MEESVELLNKSLRFMLNHATEEKEDRPRVAITLTCPAFEDSPIIGTLVGFEEVTGRSTADTIGCNCRFLNQGCQNDQSALAFMRGIQSSPEAARQFTLDHPTGRQFLLMNKRPIRTLSSRPSDDTPFVLFFNLVHIFGVDVVAQGDSYPVLAGVQWVLASGGELDEATAKVREVQRLLTSDDSDLFAIFSSWCTETLNQFVQLNNSVRRDGDSFSIPRSLHEKKNGYPQEDVEGASRARITFLIRTLAAVEEIAVTRSKASVGNHISNAQLGDMFELRDEVFEQYRTDLLQYISWYTVQKAFSLECAPFDSPEGTPRDSSQEGQAATPAAD
jgi:hypothetical protein